MVLIMGVRGARFVAFLKLKLRQRKGSIDGYNDADFARELKVEYPTFKRWLRKGSADRLDLDHYYAVEDLFGDEFKNYMRGQGADDSA